MAEAKSPERPSAAPAAQNKSLDDDEPPQAKVGDDFANADNSATLFAQEAKVARDVPASRSGTRSGMRGSDKQQTSDAGLGDTGSNSPSKSGSNNSSLDAEIEACNSDPEKTRMMMEKVRTARVGEDGSSQL